jgi:hypothetical protein
MIIVQKDFNNYDETFSTTLDNVSYQFRVRWNDVSKSWYLYIGFQGREPIYKTRLTVNRDLLLPIRFREDCPKGMLFVQDVEKIFGRPSFDDFGASKRFRLAYFTEEEIESVRT